MRKILILSLAILFFLTSTLSEGYASRCGDGVCDVGEIVTCPQDCKLELSLGQISSSISTVIKNIRAGPPEWFKDILLALNVPEDLVQNWVIIGLFVVFPWLFFTALVGGVFKDTLPEISSVFKNKWICYLVGFMFVLALTSLGYIGPFLLWLWTSSSALILYMSFFLFFTKWVSTFVGKIERFKYRGTSFIALVVFGLGYFLGLLFHLLGWVMTLGMYFLALFMWGYFLKIWKRKTITRRIRRAAAARAETEEIENEILKKIKEEMEKDDATPQAVDSLLKDSEIQQSLLQCGREFKKNIEKLGEYVGGLGDKFQREETDVEKALKDMRSYFARLFRDRKEKIGIPDNWIEEK